TPIIVPTTWRGCARPPTATCPRRSPRTSSCPCGSADACLFGRHIPGNKGAGPLILSPSSSGTLCLSSVVFVRLHRPEPLIVAGRVRAVGLRWIAVDQRPQVHGVGGAAHLVLDREQVSAARRIDDVAKAVLVLVVLARNQTALRQPAVRTREVGDVKLHMVAVEIGLRPVGLAKLQKLLLARPHACDGTIAVPCF